MKGRTAPLAVGTPATRSGSSDTPVAGGKTAERTALLNISSQPPTKVAIAANGEEEGATLPLGAAGAIACELTTAFCDCKVIPR